MRRIAYINKLFRCELTINRKNEHRANTVQENPELNDVRLLNIPRRPVIVDDDDDD